MIAYLSATDAARLRQAHRTLMVPSFRAAELMPEDAFVAQFAGGADAVLAEDTEGRMQGLAVVEHFDGADLLQYLVVTPGSRGSGVGSGLLRTVLSQLPTRLLLAEFDRPDVQSSHPVHGDPDARLRFYARFGAIALDLPYFQPPVSAATGREHGMLLSVFDTDGAISRAGALDDAQSRTVQGYLDAILDGADDPDARRLQDAAHRSPGIRVLPLAHYAEIARSPL